MGVKKCAPIPCCSENLPPALPVLLPALPGSSRLLGEAGFLQGHLLFRLILKCRNRLERGVNFPRSFREAVEDFCCFQEKNKTNQGNKTKTKTKKSRTKTTTTKLPEVLKKVGFCNHQLHIGIETLLFWVTTAMLFLFHSEL